MMRSITAVFLLGLSLTSAQDRTEQKEGLLRLLRASLTSPDADPVTILQDARNLFDPDLFPSDDELEELLGDIIVAPPYCANTDVNVDADVDADADDELSPYIDRHVRRVNSILEDDDCMKREFDAADPNFNPKDAAAVLSKCRLLILRNAFSNEDIQNYQQDVEKYFNDLHFGRISPIGKTTLDENGFFVRRNQKRFDVLFPRDVMHPNITGNSNVLKILGDPQVLSRYFVVNTVGAVISESGAPDGSYHYDDGYLLEPQSFQNYGIAGADVPPYALTAFIPLLNTTMDHGPTEFCMGTNFFKGLDRLNPKVRDKTLIAQGTPWYELAKFETAKKNCPEKYRRKPLGNTGDIIFFDYTITHRGTANVSPDLRAMSYIMYSRKWFRDLNFEDINLAHRKQEAAKFSPLQKLTRTTRFAILSGNEEVTYERVPLEKMENFMDPHTRVVVQNNDVESASLYSGETYVKDVPVGTKVAMSLRLGSTLTLYNHSSEKDVTSWKIEQGQAPITLRRNEILPNVS